MTDISLKGRGPFTVFAPSSEAFEDKKKQKVTKEKFLFCFSVLILLLGGGSVRGGLG